MLICTNAWSGFLHGGVGGLDERRLALRGALSVPGSRSRCTAPERQHGSHRGHDAHVTFRFTIFQAG